MDQAVVNKHVVRGGLKEAPKEKVGILQQIRNQYKKLRSKSRQLRKTERKLIAYDQKLKGKAHDQAFYTTLARAVLPPRIQEYESHLEFNRRTLVRNHVLGIPLIDVPCYPSDMNITTFNKFQMLAGQGARVMLSSKFCKVPVVNAERQYMKQWRMLQVENEKDKLYNPGGAADPGTTKQIQAVENSFGKVWERAENTFLTQVIFSIKGNEQEVLNTESKFITTAGRHRIAAWCPETLQKRAWAAALPGPMTDHRFLVEAPTDVASCLVAASNINNPSDPSGIWFATNKITGAHIIWDPRLMGAFHGIWFGATRGGKTYSSQTVLSRLKDMLNVRIVYMTRKEPDVRKGYETDYEAMSRFYGEEACNIMLGDRNSSINLIQPLGNYKSKDWAYGKAWDGFRRGLSVSFKKWFDGEFSPNMESMLEDTLDTVYRKAGINRNDPRTWKVKASKKQPNISDDCRPHWKHIMGDKDNYSFEDRRAAGALYRKTRNAVRGGSMEYLLGDLENNYTNIDLSKEWITIDLSQVDIRIQDALYIWISTALSIYFNADTSRYTVFYIDEARALMQDKEMSKLIMDFITMGGTKGVALWLSTQQPKDLEKADMVAEMKTNMRWGVVMGAYLDKESVIYVKKYFGLSDQDCTYLLSCKPGEGLFIKDGDVTPVWFETIPLEKQILKNQFENEEPETVSGYRIKEAYLKKGIDGKNFIEKNGFMLKEMIEGGHLIGKEYSKINQAILADGWKSEPLVYAYGGKGKTILYYKPGSLTEDLKYITEGYNGYGTHSKEHLSITLQDTVYTIEKGLKAKININNLVDIEFEYINSEGKTCIGAAEIELSSGHKSKEELAGKVSRVMKYDDYRIITDDPSIFDGLGVPAGKVIEKGKKFAEWIDSLIEEAKTPTPNSGLEVVEEDENGQSYINKDQFDEQNEEVISDQLPISLDVVKSGNEEIGAF